MKKNEKMVWETHITMIDENKINKLFQKRHRLIMFLDELSLKHQIESLYWRKKIVRIDTAIEKARKGKTIKTTNKNERKK